MTVEALEASPRRAATVRRAMRRLGLGPWADAVGAPPMAMKLVERFDAVTICMQSNGTMSGKTQLYSYFEPLAHDIQCKTVHNASGKLPESQMPILRAAFPRYLPGPFVVQY